MSFRQACGTLGRNPADPAPNPLPRRLFDPERRAELASQPTATDRALLSWIDALAGEQRSWPERVALAQRWHTPVRVPHRNHPMSPRQLRAQLLAAPHHRHRSQHGKVFATIAGPLCEAHHDMLERRVDATNAAPLLHVAEADSDRVSAAAVHLLARTDDAARERQHRGWIEGVHAAIGRDAHEGWPARLRPRWLTEIFGASEWTAGLDIHRVQTPTVWGGSSFSRAIGQLATMVLDLARPSDMPFSVHQHPWGARRHQRYALFASLPLEPSFANRIMGLGKDRARNQQRAMAGALLCALRLDALRVVLASAWPRGRAAQAETLSVTSEQLFGEPMPPTLLAVLPQLHPGDGPSFVGSLLAIEKRQMLIDRFDEDWFRNPTALGWLRHQDTLPRRDESLAADTLARSVEGLGRLTDDWLA